MLDRLSRARELLSAEKIDALVITKCENVRYITGFTGTNGFAILTPSAATFITDPRYSEQAEAEVGSCDRVIYDRELLEKIAGFIEEAEAPAVEETMAIGFYNRLRAAAGGMELKAVDGLIEKLRVHKDPEEVAAIRRAVECASKAWESLLPMLQPGVTERQVASALDYRMLTAGADRPAFDTIAASGPNSSMPHAGITDRVIEDGDLVVIDFGAKKDGYCCDLTRTVSVGTPDAGRMRALDAVRQAWEAALEKLSPGTPAAEVDLTARERLAALGMDEYFKHGLGHGVGLEVHEKPTISRLGTDVIEPGMVFTIEPGVYFEGEYGARHEETVLMTGEGPEILTKEIGLG